MIDIVVLESFKEWMQKQKLSKSSQISYGRDVKIFFQKYGDHITGDVIEKKLLESFINDVNSAFSTRKRRFVSMRKLYEFSEINKQFLMSKDFSISSDEQINSTITPDLLSPEEIKMLLNMPTAHNAKESRDKAIFETLYSTGIRINELCGIKLIDVDIIVGYLSFTRNRSKITIPINNKINFFLIEYIKNFRIRKEFRGEYLFINKSNERLSRQSIWKIVLDCAKKGYPEKKITPYSLRKAFAIQMSANGASYDYLSQILGTKDISFLLEQKNVVENKYIDFYKYHPSNKQ